MGTSQRASRELFGYLSKSITQAFWVPCEEQLTKQGYCIFGYLATSVLQKLMVTTKKDRDDKEGSTATKKDRSQQRRINCNNNKISPAKSRWLSDDNKVVHKASPAYAGRRYTRMTTTNQTQWSLAVNKEVDKTKTSKATLAVSPQG